MKHHTRYEVSISGIDLESVHISSSLDVKDGTCDGGKVLGLVENTYIAEAEYGWVKTAYFVPIDSHKPIKICAFGKGGHKLYWAENIGVYGSEYPKLWKFKCEVVNEVLHCEKIT